MTAPGLPETCAPPELRVATTSAVYLGPALGLAPHSTSVHCLAVGVDAPFRLVADGLAVTTRSALVPPRVVHQLVAEPGTRMLFCYTDPTRARAAGQRGRMRRSWGDFGLGHHDEAELIELCRRSPFDPAAAVALAVGPPVRPTDPRIVRTLDRIREDPASTIGAAGLARREHLSTPHLLRLIGAETGTSFRRYRMWARMLHVGRRVADGADLTTAAVEAGFATPSHFSDSFRRMFGLTATELMASGAVLVIDE